MDLQESAALGSEHSAAVIEDSSEPVLATEESIPELQNEGSEEVPVKDEDPASDTDKSFDNQYNHNDETRAKADDDNELVSGGTNELVSEKIEPVDAEETVEDSEVANGHNVDTSDDSSKTFINVKTDLIKSDDSEKCDENSQDVEMKENHLDDTDNLQPTSESASAKADTETVDVEDEVEDVPEIVNTLATSQEDEAMDVDQLNNSSDVKNDESRGKDSDPTFEDAPEHNANDATSEDHREALDPFDELLKGGTSKPKSPTREISTNTDDINDDSHMDNEDSHIDNDDSHVDNHEDGHTGADNHDVSKDDDDRTELSQEVTDLMEDDEDEEVCLLPDMEREISEADKEKALAAKIDSSEPEPSSERDMAETVEGGETDKIHDAATNNGSEEPVVDDVAEKDKSLEEDDHEHDADHDAPIMLEEQLAPNTIQEMSPAENTCVQCNVDKSCKYRMLQEDVTRYLCTKDCLDSFQEASPDKYTLAVKTSVIEEINAIRKNCARCNKEELCQFVTKSENEERYYCTNACVDSVVIEEKEIYVIRRRKVTIEEITEKEANCDKCEETKMCRFEMKIKGEVKYICGDDCIKKLTELQPRRFKVKRKKIIIKTPMQPLLRLKVISNATDKYLDQGSKVIAKTAEQAAAARADRERSFQRKCHQCHATITGDEKNLTWETMDFCNEGCLGKYQNKIGSKCANCKNPVNSTSLGKYCVRFGYDIRQFCRSGCLEEFKKGLKICCYCQRDISGSFEGFLAPVGDKGQFKDFCSQACVAKFDQMSKNPVPPPVWAKCAVCSKEKPTSLEVAINKNSSQRLCSEPCFAAFKFVNSVVPDQCRWCKKYFERKSKEAYTIYTDMVTHCFCTKACMNVYISNSRHIVPCNWCKVKKYNFDMIRKQHSSGQSVMMCSLNCLTLYQVSVNAVSSKKIKCDQCKRTSQAQYHLTMSDATVRNFCTYQCVMSFQGQYAKPGQTGAGPDEPGAVPTGAPRRTYAMHKNNVNTPKAPVQQMQKRSALPVISNVQSLASQPPEPSPHATRAKSKRFNHREPALSPKPQHKTYPKALPKPPPKPVKEPPPPRPVTPPPPPPPPPPQIYNHVVVKTLPPVEVANKGTLTKPLMLTKGVSCRPHPCTKECQTDSSLERRILIPIPVPIYVPVPIAMYSMPFPVPVPIPIPIPTPVFIPTTRNSANGILKEIKKIHEKMPTDPFEAELLMMAEMVAGEKKKNESDSETDDENADEGFSPDAMDGGNNFGEDMLQMALKMATEYEEPAVDLESAMTASTITPSSHPPMQGLDEAGNPMQPHHHHQMMLMEQQRAATAAAMRGPAGGTRKRGAAAATTPRAPRPPYKRRRGEASVPTPPPPQPEPAREPVEKPDANMCLKYTFGVNAWKQWVMTKNAEIEKSSIRRKPFKSEILQLTADELNYSLCLFVKEVRKPNGSEYAPDTIYYLVLGIQQYLFENGRIDNIFTDPYYEKFTECLDEVARKFSVLYNDSQYIVTRVEEEHLWESKQLGAHSPHVLLSTLMFFNTKHFNLVVCNIIRNFYEHFSCNKTEEEHMQLSFSHIMKHWKRNPNQPGVAKLPGSRNVLLRFYPPQAALDANSRKKKVYEQQENEENPLRCPVKLYEFYLSKCPESVKTRNDVFYLMPERSCVPDSPVWYSTQPLAREALSKMLHRVKMVKEINIALLTS